MLLEMQDATEKADSTIAFLSPDYLKAKFTQPEWSTALAQDPGGQLGILVPVRARDIDLPGMQSAIVYIDLVGLTQKEAKQALLVQELRESCCKTVGWLRLRSGGFI